MIARAGSGWQTILADLSLILFMASASVVVAARPGGEAVQASARSEPVAVYHARADAPPLGQWLAQQQADPRLLLTITAHYRDQSADAALASARALLAQAGDGARRARIVIEPGPDALSAVLAYDQPQGELARELQNPRGNRNSQ